MILFFLNRPLFWGSPTRYIQGAALENPYSINEFSFIEQRKSGEALLVNSIKRLTKTSKCPQVFRTLHWVKVDIAISFGVNKYGLITPQS